ncbi:MAG: aspartate kinase [Candidatus Hydrogenedentota bacterium]
MTITCKFGGTSLADANQVKKVNNIINDNKERRYIVVSAPGKRDKKDIKITDLLYHLYKMAEDNMDYTDTLNKIKDRYNRIIKELNLNLDLEDEYKIIVEELEKGTTPDYIASRGEYLMGKIMAKYLNAQFIEPQNSIFITGEGKLKEITYEILGNLLKRDGLFVVPGFYGAGPNNLIKTFSRGGSDVTGSIVARATSSSLYENWTDVSGFHMADPNIIPDAKPMKEVSYRELRELAYMGATVLHDEAIFPVREKNIPIRIKNTNEPQAEGTLIVGNRDYRNTPVIGIAGRKNFSMVYIEKALMNKEKGFGRRLLAIVESHDISFEHTPTSIDSMCVIMSDSELKDKGEDLLDDIQRVFQPDRVELIKNLALIATVGEGMVYRVGTAARLFGAVSRAGVNIRVINQGASELNIIIGIENKDFENAVKAIYYEFIK